MDAREFVRRTDRLYPLVRIVQIGSSQLTNRPRTT